MAYARSKAARLREFRRLGKVIRDAQRTVETQTEARNQLLLANERAEDRATSEEIGAASGEGFSASAARNALKRLRSR